MANKTIIQLKYEYLIADYKENNNTKSAIEICDMIINKDVKITHRRDSRLLFILHSKFQGKCLECGEIYKYGDAIFCINQKAWHLECASTEDKKQTFFLACLKKGLIDEE